MGNNKSFYDSHVFITQRLRIDQVGGDLRRDPTVWAKHDVLQLMMLCALIVLSPAWAIYWAVTDHQRQTVRIACSI